MYKSPLFENATMNLEDARFQKYVEAFENQPFFDVLLHSSSSKYKVCSLGLQSFPKSVSSSIRKSYIFPVCSSSLQSYFLIFQKLANVQVCSIYKNLASHFLDANNDNLARPCKIPPYIRYVTACNVYNDSLQEIGRTFISCFAVRTIDTNNTNDSITFNEDNNFIAIKFLIIAK